LSADDLTWINGNAAPNPVSLSGQGNCLRQP